MSDIFISYAREDREKAEHLARAFEQQRWTVWWDKVIPPGRKYADVIAEELASAKAVVVLWSGASIASDWVKDEAQEGASRGVLVPAFIEKVSPPYGFRQVQTADLSDWDGSASHAELQSLVRGVGALISKPVTDLPKPAPVRRPLPYLLTGGALVLLLLGFAAFRLIPMGDRGNKGAGQGGVENSGVTQRCEAEARRKAAELTGRGLIMIDPGGNHQAAVLQFNEAVRECPGYADAYLNRGQSFVALNQNARALADFRKVLELSSDAGDRRLVEGFIADLEKPPPTATPTTTNTNATNTSATNTSGANTASSNSNGGKLTPLHVAQVNAMFAADKPTRIAATTRLIIERKQDPAAARQAVKTARAQPDNKSGVINTLVFLESADPTILKQLRPEIEDLLEAVKNNGPETTVHINKVRGLLKP